MRGGFGNGSMPCPPAQPTQPTSLRLHCPILPHRAARRTLEWCTSFAHLGNSRTLCRGKSYVPQHSRAPLLARTPGPIGLHGHLHCTATAAALAGISCMPYLVYLSSSCGKVFHFASLPLQFFLEHRPSHPTHRFAPGCLSRTWQKPS